MALDRDIFHLQPRMTAKVRQFLNDVLYEYKYNKQVFVPRLFLNEGLRSYARQNALYAQGRRTAGPIVTQAKGGASYHNFGLGVDVYPYLINSDQVDWNFDPESKGWLRVLQLAKKNELSNGGQMWGWDHPHFQDSYAPYLFQCRRKWPKGWKA